MPISLPPHEDAVLKALTRAESDLGYPEIVEATDLDQSLVAVATAALAERGWITVSERAVTEGVLTDAGGSAAEGGTPERRLLELLDEGGAARA